MKQDIKKNKYTTSGEIDYIKYILLFLVEIQYPYCIEESGRKWYMLVSFVTFFPHAVQGALFSQCVPRAVHFYFCGQWTKYNKPLFSLFQWAKRDEKHILLAFLSFLRKQS